MLDYSKEKESMGEQVDPFDLTKKQEADLQRIRQFRLIDGNENVSLSTRNTVRFVRTHLKRFTL